MSRRVESREPTQWVIDSDEKDLMIWVHVSKTMGTNGRVTLSHHKYREDEHEEVLATYRSDETDLSDADMVNTLRRMLETAERRMKDLEQSQSDSNK